jgi:hypothetical protein
MPMSFPARANRTLAATFVTKEMPVRSCLPEYTGGD